MSQGILAAGNWIVDYVKVVDRWPAQDTLASILRQSTGTGGSPYNLLLDLAKLGAPFPLSAIGLVGEDEAGRSILRHCQAHGIDTRQLGLTASAPTSFTDVMTVESTARRTFFHQRGANAHLGPEHFDFSRTSAKIFHLGYLLLLDRLDGLEGGQPGSLTVLQRAKAAGLITSVDCVSEDSDRFQSVISPVLPSVDLFFANDFEAEKLTKIPLRPHGKIDADAVAQAGQRLIALGVQCWVVIHFPEAVYACSAGGDTHWQPSLRVPPAEIAGAAGAGDALTAGVLFGFHENWPLSNCLRLGVSVAAASLSHPTCSEGIHSLAAAQALADRLGFHPLP